MTGGIVAVLGRAGRNFAAGMSNGVAYVLDEARTFETRVNHDLVQLGELDSEDLELLQRLIREHEEKTASPRARMILVRWEEFVAQFRKVTPKGVASQVEAIRQSYLSSASTDAEAFLARRSA
jgi:glutamate synthase domain-containing protein 3